MDYPFILSLSGSIIVILFGIIGYLLKSMRTESQKTYTDLIEATTNIREASIELRSSVSNMRTNCIDKHGIVDKRLEQHALKLSEHDLSIATLKAKLK